MLGLGNALTTGSPHEQMYSAIFDGTGDYINTGDAFQSTHRGSFSYSFWMKPDDGQPGSIQRLFGTTNSGAEDAFWVDLQTDGKINVRHEANNDPADYVTDAAVYSDGAGDWKHICVTVTDGDTGNSSYIIYVDGSAVAGTLSNAVAGTAHDDWTSTDNVYIGGLNNAGTINTVYAGKIDEFALFNVVLDADAVAAIYNSATKGPFDLNKNRGNYDNSSALVAYWRMFNGPFDDLQNGIVHDAHNPGYGSELWDGTDGDDANWDVQGSNTKAEDSGAVKITYVDNAGGALIYLKDSKDLNTDLTVGATYKLTFESKVNTGSTGWLVRDGAASGYVEYTSSSNNHTDFQGKTIYFVAQHATNAFLANYAMGSGEIAWIKNISLTKLNGYPAIAAADATFSTDTPDD